MSKRGKARVRIGTSGYQYDHWRNVLYPEDLPKSEWLKTYAREFDTVEVNNTFYNLPENSTFENWRDQAPKDFLFVLKFSRYGTHMKKLKDPKATIGLFVDRAEILGSRLGPILVQLPPKWHADPARLKAFLDAAPRKHRWAVEFREPSWLCEEVYDVLRGHNAALCVHDLLEEHPHVVTADWVYLRFHGAGNGGGYPHQALTASAQRIAGHLDAGRDVFAYFNNDAHGYAVHNAAELRRYIGRAA